MLGDAWLGYVLKGLVRTNTGGEVATARAFVSLW